MSEKVEVTLEFDREKILEYIREVIKEERLISRLDEPGVIDHFFEEGFKHVIGNMIETWYASPGSRHDGIRGWFDDYLELIDLGLVREGTDTSLLT